MPGHDEQDGTAGYSDARRTRNYAIAARLERTGQRVALARIERERRRLAIEEERILSRPDEPLPMEQGDDGPVIYFRKSFGNRSIPNYGGYQYVAVRTQSERDIWFLTGPKAPRDGMSWDQLLDFIIKDEADDTRPEIWKALEWGAIEWARTIDPD